MQIILITIGIFFLLQTINVILNTLKTLVMTRTDNPHISAVVNAITFGFYTLIVKQVATLDLSITVIVTIVTNIIGVYISYAIMNKARRDDLWKIEIFSASRMQEVVAGLTTAQIAFTPINEKVAIAYAYTQKESTVVKEIICKTSAKYNVTVVTKRL